MTPKVYTWKNAGRMCTRAIVDFFRPTINVERKASISKARQITGRSPPCVPVITYLLWSMIYTYSLERVPADYLFRMTLRDALPCGRRNLYFGTYPTGKT